MIKVVTTFSGYDSQCLALRDAGVDFELVAWSEIDKYAIAAHDCIFPEWSERNIGDIRYADWDSIKEKHGEIDLLTYSAPCTDISSIGKQLGITEGSDTRSSLIWEVKKAIETLRPKYLLLENVKALVSKKFKSEFERWLSILADYGYESSYCVMNASDYGVPQNRERVFVVSWLRGVRNGFDFPEPVKLERKLIDLIVDDAPKKTYIPDMYYKWKVNGEVADENSFNKKQKVIKKLFDEGKLCTDTEGEWIDVYNKSARNDGITGTITTRVYASNHNYVTQFVDGEYVIRHLVPKECFRLMGVKDDDFEKIKGIPFPDMFVLAGNSIVVNCMTGIFNNMFKNED